VPSGSALRISPIRRAARSLTVTLASMERPFGHHAIGIRPSR
jgi:hypothetical protein